MTAAPSNALSRRGRSALVVEDELLIAFAYKRLLGQAGWDVLGPAHTVAEGLALLEQRTPDVALLDLNLRGELVLPVADVLAQRGVPIVVASAYSSAGFVTGSAVIDGAPRLSKPVSPADLLKALGNAALRH
jgi:CheY-like chemotaxis protein